MANPAHRRRRHRRGNAHRHEPHRFGALGPATPANHALAHQCSLDPGPLGHADLPISAILRKADTQLLCLLQMGQTRSLPLAQAFKVPIRHRALHLSGNSAAVQSFAGSDHGEKYGVAGVVTTRSRNTRTDRAKNTLYRAVSRTPGNRGDSARVSRFTPHAEAVVVLSTRRAASISRSTRSPRVAPERMHRQPNTTSPHPTPLPLHLRLSTTR